MVDNPFTAFIDLVTYDASIRALKNKKSTIISDLEQLNSLYSLLERDQLKVKEKISLLRREVDTLEREINELDENSIEKQRRLSLANSPKEYFSLQQEIETLESAKQNADDTLLALWNTLDQEQQRYNKLVADTAEQRRNLEQKMQALQQQRTQLDEEIALRQLHRSEKEQGAPTESEWLEKYKIMLTRVENPVVPVQNASCSACFYPIASQDLAALKRHKLLDCKGCYRILYHI